MSADARRRDAEPLSHHPDDVLFPAGRGNVVVYLGKEALLSWFTDVRSEMHRETTGRFQQLCRSRAIYTTNVYQLVEVFTKVRYAKSAKTVERLRSRIGDSTVRVVHGSDDWSDNCQERTPKDVFDAATGLFEERSGIEFSFPEAALVLALARESWNRDVPVYLFTFDGTLATLADTFDVPVLPYSTPLRDDAGR
ncbi:hypothetical protein [Halorussus sp. MSC15.2]|uniref:hypothetical protein n=1 Tax=Halorussus sp. MSC15.2 TaxID=2283638 RepID=UPI0013D4C2B2|nr:hypothetical protein [Halorussus sp. MSC15.2]NEU55739.1 hypothetical protein [Halorussus sp. MSC15.2]